MFQQGRWFLNKGVRIYYSKEPTKLEPFAHFFQRCRQKINSSDFIFSKGADKNWRLQIPVILSGGRVQIKMECPCLSEGAGSKWDGKWDIPK